MLAQVFNVRGKLDADNLEALLKVATVTRSLDGCEGIYFLNDGSDEGLAIALWRDQAALDAATPKEREDIQQADEQLGIVAGSAKVYDNVTSI
jgi:hypothetical protein